ncbi:flagellar biosynthetic protein FliO [Pseudoduganella plicata]|uniref:Flagellar protein n=1 Tax=Pseudoduganella plicata TaxID=321984 RepID=A0A4P7BFT0_9BURK|nr:flagellar biosynthetic protein FliO [Pseudoduganella plicata]QBQ36425.1 flagellar biosynthetic protein FliO [Pseudoduganella plicata]GGY77034.1 hypothetical protein GCM10007388_07260 [Pseudoduganella plicata]
MTYASCKALSTTLLAGILLTSSFVVSAQTSSTPVVTAPINRTVAPVKAGEPATVPVDPAIAGAPATAPVAETPDPAAPAQPRATTPEQQAALAGARPVTPTAMPAAPSAAGSLLQTVAALAAVLAIVMGLAWMLKRFGPKTVTGGSAVKLVGAMSVGTRERILVVEVGDQWIVVGASPGRMNALATMPRQEAAASMPGPHPNLPATNFSEWFKQTIEKRNGK